MAVEPLARGEAFVKLSDDRRTLAYLSAAVVEDWLKLREHLLLYGFAVFWGVEVGGVRTAAPWRLCLAFVDPVAVGAFEVAVGVSF